MVAEKEWCQRAEPFVEESWALDLVFNRNERFAEHNFPKCVPLTARPERSQRVTL
jgi:hypothetical protein